MVCALLVVLDANLPKPQSRAEIPSLMLMAALPHRRLQHESRRQPVGMEAVDADTARAEIAGFTLIEMAIVLVIIGLLVGGVLYGQELISKAAVRAQISQIEQFQTAANTFFGKYGYLPGDIRDPDASNFGFIARGPYAGEGDGNGIIEGNPGSPGYNSGTYENGGETEVFWRDLATAHLIPGSFPGAGIGFVGGSPSLTAAPFLQNIFPQAAIGGPNYVYVYSNNQTNYYSFSGAIPHIAAGPPSLTVQQAYSIDSKIDDGLPQSGHVIAQYLNESLPYCNPAWAAGSNWGASTPWPACMPTTTATPGSSITCYDNGNTAGLQQTYSLTQNNGAGVNCALSFKMQAGD